MTLVAAQAARIVLDSKYSVFKLNLSSILVYIVMWPEKSENGHFSYVWGGTIVRVWHM